MDRRKFLARVAQLTAGAAVVATGAEMLGSESIASNVPYYGFGYVPEPEASYSVAEMKKDIAELWARYAAQSSVVIVSPASYRELLSLAGFLEARQGKLKRFTFGGVEVRCSEHLAPGMAFKINKFPNHRGAFEERMSSTNLQVSETITPRSGAAASGEEA